MLGFLQKKDVGVKPKYSFIFQSYDMKEEVVNTLLSVEPEYQGFSKDLFEVLLVENPSENTIKPEDIDFYNGNIKLIKNEYNTPVTLSLNNAIKQAKGDYLVICIDAARILSPGVIKYCEQATCLAEKSIVAFHAFHLGLFPQQYSLTEGLYSKEMERQFLEDIKFPNNPKALFNRSCWAGSSKLGYFSQMAESNCLMVPRELFEEIGGLDERLDSPSGGIANLDLYNRVLEHEDHRLFFVLGEGSFHQYHGGDTTSAGENKFQKYRQEFYEKTGKEWRFPKRINWEFLGHVPHESVRLVKESAVKAADFYSVRRPPKILGNIAKALDASDQGEVDFSSVQVYTILSMHRSKSSFLAKALADKLDVRIPGTVLGGSSISNPRGHFEPHEIVVLHNRILSEFGQSWRSISPIDLLSRGEEFFDYCVDRIRRVLHWGCQDIGGKILIKDPRLCRLLPMWDSVLERSHSRAKRIAIMDHPAKVAKSLYKRDALPFDWGELLWLRYNLDLLNNLAEEDLVLNMHSEPAEQVQEKLQNYLGMDEDFCSDLLPNGEIESKTEISRLFDRFVNDGKLDDFKAGLADVEKFISERSDLFRHLDDYMREVS